ncbi:hypothetical protein DAH51_10280 [Sphingobium yanoikuyae]|uniref:Tape measure protein N-terminal domain-containing protein n=2 Tax=Sphingobium yanoikuyae TaxID=13690 RepID=A0A430BX60_SPHYA|nr:hypothetical protein DAH51_10280 [Sphingobium yanoikuyae]
MKFSMILEAIDRASRPTERIRKSTGDLGRTAQTTAGGFRNMSRATDTAARSTAQLDRRMDQASRSASRLDRAGSRVGAGVTRSARSAARALFDLDRRIQFSQAQMEKLAYRSGSFIGSTLKSGLMAGTAIAGAGLSASIYKVVTSGLMFEKFRTQLIGLEGSAAAGNRAMQWVSDFAAKTPYELAEVMEAFIALKAYGIDPTNGTLKSLGDTAAGMGKSLMQAVEMIADAQTGEFERIKEFGIKASTEGGKVTFRWQKNGKEMTKTVRQTSTEIRQALLGIMDARFAGGMERLAQTTAGKWSTLMDNLTISANRVWEGGVGAAVNKQIDRLSDWLGEMEKDGSLKKWADESGQSIGDFIATISSMDWKSIAADIRGVAGAFGEVAHFLAELDRIGGKGRKFLADGQDLWGYRESLGSVQLDPRYGFGYKAPSWMRSKPQPQAKPSGVPFFDAAPQTKPNAVPFFEAAPRPARPSPLKPSASAKAPSGKISIDIKTDRGTSARPTKVAASDLDLEVNTGRAMGGMA